MMQDHGKEIVAKTAGGATTFATTYIFSMTVQDIQAYSIIFASVATGLYYLVQVYLSIRKSNRGKN